MWNTDYEPAQLSINGNIYDVEVGVDFVETVRIYAKTAGYSKVKVFLIENGVEYEVNKGEAPEYVKEGMEIIIRPYEKAA